MVPVTEGQFSTGVPFLRLGQGPPLLVASGLTGEHVNPTGMRRRMALAWTVPFAEHFTVYLVNRRAVRVARSWSPPRVSLSAVDITKPLTRHSRPPAAEQQRGISADRQRGGQPWCWRTTPGSL
jgi:hypothetical protein